MKRTPKLKKKQQKRKINLNLINSIHDIYPQ